MKSKTKRTLKKQPRLCPELDLHGMHGISVSAKYTSHTLLPLRAALELGKLTSTLLSRLRADMFGEHTTILPLLARQNILPVGLTLVADELIFAKAYVRETRSTSAQHNTAQHGRKFNLAAQSVT